MTEYVVWINRLKRIASFHEEDGYERMEFRYEAHFLMYLTELSDNGFRFM